MFNFPTTRIIAKRPICAFYGQKSFSHKPNGAAPNTSQTPPPPDLGAGMRHPQAVASGRRHHRHPTPGPGCAALPPLKYRNGTKPSAPCSWGRDASPSSGSIRRAAPPPPAPGVGMRHPQAVASGGRRRRHPAPGVGMRHPQAVASGRRHRRPLLPGSGCVILKR